MLGVFFDLCVLVCEENGMLSIFSLIFVFQCVRKTECWEFFFFNLCVLVCEEDGMLGVFFFNLRLLVCEEDGMLGAFFL